MTRNCKCGGKLHRTDIRLDIIASRRYGRPLYNDLDTKSAHWQCDKCGDMFMQGKRQPVATYFATGYVAKCKSGLSCSVQQFPAVVELSSEVR